jgi:hypothetical protein
MPATCMHDYKLTAGNKQPLKSNQGEGPHGPAKLAQGAREMAAARPVPLHAIFEAAVAAYLSPGA